MLKINDALSLKCIYVAPGRFFMGEPLYQGVHGSAGEDAPHMVTLTKGYYLAEHPITQEMFEAVTGYDPTPEKFKQAKAPVNVLVRRHVQVLRAALGEDRPQGPHSHGRGMGLCGPLGHLQSQVSTEVRGPHDQGQARDKRPPVKSAQPNAWGFYDYLLRRLDRARQRQPQ